MKTLVTGAAGFIGFHVARYLLERGDSVIGVDNLNDYYDVRLKEARLARLKGLRGFSFRKLDLADDDRTAEMFRTFSPDRVIHLAAQAGVRYSLQNPHAYMSSNLVGFLNVLEGCRQCAVEHLTYASSSSVYGASTAMPFSTRQSVDHPISLYAATKKANELMAHTYSHLFGLPTTGLRFFTVYGPWGRPDMAPMLFAKAILDGKPIDIFNEGRMRRDFTFIDDIVEGVARVSDRIAAPNKNWNGQSPELCSSSAPYRIYNIGNSQPVELLRFIELLEQGLGRTARKRFLPMQPGDVAATYADVNDLAADIGFKPTTPIEKGVAEFVEWFRSYHAETERPM
jgi:UDP-glucuronate 4-epimerase